nr:MAG TPA: hypothetical protein [Caudoviricetes sp.]
MCQAFAAAVSGRPAGGAGDPGVVRLPDDLLPQGAGGVEHRGHCGCPAGAAVNFAAANKGWMNERPAFLCCQKVRSIFALRFVIG